MTICKECFYLGGVFGGFGVVGAASAVVSAQVAKKFFGHTFMRCGYSNPYLIGLMGAIQNIATIALSILWLDPEKKDRTKITFAASVISAFALNLLTHLAAKVNLISAGLTLTGMTVLATTGFAGTFLFQKMGEKI